jgi:hypothetical protein
MVLIVAGGASTGGLAALAVRVSRKKNGTGEMVSNLNNKEDEDVDEHNWKPENSVTK